MKMKNKGKNLQRGRKVSKVKRSISLLLIVSLMLSIIMIPEKSFAEEEEKEEVNNTITCEWKENNRTLVLKGKGRLADSKWEDKVKTWYPTLKKLIISDGITSIGAGFIGKACNYIEILQFPEGMTVLEESVISDMKNLKQVILPTTLRTVDESAIDISECKQLKTLCIPDSVTFIGNSNFSYSYYLKKLILPKSLQICEDKFTNCPALKTIINRSSLSIPLNNCKKRKTWYVAGKKKSKVPAGKTAKAKGKRYKIKYKLKGGKVKGKLPKSYRYGDELKISMKKVTKKGWYLIRWDIYGSEPEIEPFFYGTATAYADWIKYKVKNVKGKKIKIYVRDYKRLTEFGFIVRYATKKDMSNAKYYPKDGWGNDFKWGKKATKYTLKGLKKGKKYYIEIAPRHSEDIGDWYGKRCVKVKK